jgi:hypothetical protein
VYISNLVASGASVKTCQVLARHSTPSLTIGIYAKASLHDLVGAVDALPDLTPAAPSAEPQALRATGTDMLGIEDRFALPLPYSVQGTERIEKVADGSADVSMETQTPEITAPDASERVLKATGRRGEKVDANDLKAPDDDRFQQIADRLGEERGIACPCGASGSLRARLHSGGADDDRISIDLECQGCHDVTTIEVERAGFKMVGEVIQSERELEP